MITVNFNPLTDDKNIALGNHMFQYAVCRIVAEKNSYSFYIPHKSFISQCFENIDLGEKNGEILHNYIESADQTYDPNIFSVSDFTNLVGYFQTEKYFKHIEDEIREDFTFKDEILKPCKEMISSVENPLALHVRRTDYVSNSANHPPCTLEYYKVAHYLVFRNQNK
jgi:hypothetical protein